MERSPVGDWQELSALYEEADGLDAAGCAALLERLKREQHPQAAALEQMLRARDRVRSDAFLDRLPSLPSLAPPRPGEGSVAPGDHFGPYNIVRRLGAGGMAQVWLAERDDGAFQRHVAIKLPYRHAEGAQRETLVQRFARERDILAALHHPNIAALHDAGVTPAGQPWLALEMVEGEAITDWCDRQRLPVRERVRLFRQVLRAVQHAHANLVIHRDLKPANILVTPQGNVRLLDFGIAKLIEPLDGRSTDSELTREGGTPLTLQYASPEQITGLPLTTACDVYALGVVLYELLAGVRPYEPKIDSAAQIEQAIVEHEPRAPSRRVPTPEILAARTADAAGLRRALAPDLDAIVLHALAKQPQGRYPSAEALLADLDRWLGGLPVSAQRPSAWYWLRKFVGRNRLGVALGAGAVVSLIAATAVAMVMGIQARQESARAVAARDFLLDMFKQVDPERSGGRELSARQLLDAAQRRATTELGYQPALQAELLHGMSEVHAFIGDYQRARESQETILAVRRRAGDSTGVARALVDLAETAVRMGDPARARSLLKEAVDTAPAVEQNDAFLARVGWLRGWLDQFGERDPRDRLREAQVVLERSVKAFGSDDRKTIDAMRLIANIQLELKSFAAALETLSEAQRRMQLASNASRRDVVAMTVELTGVDFAAGSLAAAEARLVPALDECTRLLGESDAECGFLRFRRAVVLLVMGADERAMTLVPHLLRQARSADSPRRQAEAAIVAYRVLARNDELQQAPDLAGWLAELAASGGERSLSDMLKVSAALALAEGSLWRADSAQARRWLAVARGREAALAGAANRRTLGRLQLMEALTFQIDGDHAAALRQLEASQQSFDAAYGANSPYARLFALNALRSQVALGGKAAALATAAADMAKLQEAFGVDAPVVDLARTILFLGTGNRQVSGAGRERFFL